MDVRQQIQMATQAPRPLAAPPPGQPPGPSVSLGEEGSRPPPAPRRAWPPSALVPARKILPELIHGGQVRAPAVCPQPCLPHGSVGLAPGEHVRQDPLPPGGPALNAARPVAQPGRRVSPPSRALSRCSARLAHPSLGSRALCSPPPPPSSDCSGPTGRQETLRGGWRCPRGCAGDSRLFPPPPAGHLGSRARW